MRIAIDERDPGFIEFVKLRQTGKKIVVTLDGTEVPNVTMADEEQGILIAHVLNGEGKPQVDPEDDSRVWQRMHRGAVKIGTR